MTIENVLFYRIVVGHFSLIVYPIHWNVSLPFDNSVYLLDVRLRDVLTNLHFNRIPLEHVDKRQKLVL